MATFVLVHGAHHGGWCWYRVAALLEQRGHVALAPDLPGHGREAGRRATMRGYVDAMGDLIAGQAGPVILVGHSMGGSVITGVAEKWPESIVHLVYVAAFLSVDGATMGGPLSRSGGSDGLIPVRDSSRALYHDCPAEDAMLARLCLAPQAVEPLEAPVHWTIDRWGSIPRTFIGCSQDRVYDFDKQRRRASLVPGTNWIELPSGHSPFFSMPGALADCLVDLPAVPQG